MRSAPGRSGDMLLLSLALAEANLNVLPETSGFQVGAEGLIRVSSNSDSCYTASN